MKKSRKQRPRNAARAMLLQQLRHEHRLSIEAVALQLGVSATLISDYLAGEEMFLSDAIAIAQLFGKTLDEIACAFE